MATRSRQIFEKVIAVGFEKNHRGSGAVAFFVEDIEKLHESGRISVFTNETP